MKTLQLSRGLSCVLDDEDFVLHGGKKWSASTHRGTHAYAYRSENGRRVYLHRLIAEPAAGLHVDHIDGDTLNNRRANLRCVSSAENARNRHEPLRTSTGEPCIHVHPKGFIVRIPRPTGGRAYGGVFRELEQAVAHRNRLMIEEAA